MQQKAAYVGTVNVGTETQWKYKMLQAEILPLVSFLSNVFVCVVKVLYVKYKSHRHLTLQCSSIYASKLFRV